MIPTQSKRERTTLFGCLSFRTKKFYWKSASIGNAKSFIAFLHQMRLNFPGKRLLFILDNSSVHKNKKVKAFLEKFTEIRLLCLPTYSPEYNPVEKIWWWLKPKIYGLFALGKGLDELLARVRKLFWHFNEKRLVDPIDLKLNAYHKIINILAD